MQSNYFNAQCRELFQLPQSLLAVICSLKKNWGHYCSSRVNKLWSWCWAVMTLIFFMLKLNFIDLARTCYRPKQCSLLVSSHNHLLVSWVKIRYLNKSALLHVANQIQCKTADLDHHPVQKQGVCSDSSSLGNEVAWLASISSLSTDLKKINSNSYTVTVNSRISEQIKPLELVGQAAEFKFESKFEPLPVTWQSLLKAIPVDHWRFWLQNQCQWQSPWRSAV